MFQHDFFPMLLAIRSRLQQQTKGFTGHSSPLLWFRSRPFVTSQPLWRRRSPLLTPTQRRQKFGAFDFILPRPANLTSEILHSPPRLPVPAHIPRPEYDEVTGAPLVTLTKPSIKKDVERDVMRDAGRAAKLVLQAACQAVRPGITTAQIDAIAHAECIRLGAYPSPLGYNGYPKSICTSINNVICHGIPDDRPLLPTDILNIDVTIYINGFHADTSRTVSPDPASLDQQGQHLLDTTLKCLDAGISVCGPGVPFDRIGEIIQALARDEGFSISEDFCGHGIGRHFHEPPLIHHTSTHSTSGHMFPGMTFTIEPVLCQGMAGFVMWPDSWTAVTMDGGRSAQFEHTLLITESGVEVLTA